MCDDFSLCWYCLVVAARAFLRSRRPGVKWASERCARGLTLITSACSQANCWPPIKTRVLNRYYVQLAKCREQKNQNEKWMLEVSFTSLSIHRQHSLLSSYWKILINCSNTPWDLSVNLLPGTWSIREVADDKYLEILQLSLLPPLY